METYTRKQLMKITGLPDKTLRWLLSKLEIDPVFMTKTALGRPIYHYDYATLVCLHDYIFKQAKHKEECNRGVRCKGGCGKYFPKEEMNANQVCNHCRRRLWLRHEVYPDKSLKFDKTAFRDCNGNWVYKASVSVSGTSMNVGINAKMCNLCRNELFRVNIPIVSSTASNLVFLVTCCGSSAPLYSGVTGAQLTAASLTADVTYVITYDKFTRKFFVTGV